eukprot:scaffold223239_cov26-Tisochrysis_lutea.AAC.3
MPSGSFGSRDGMERAQVVAYSLAKCDASSTGPCLSRGHAELDAILCLGGSWVSRAKKRYQCTLLPTDVIGR